MNEEAGLVRSLFGSILQVGDARTSGPLTLAPLFGALPTGPYLLASEAVEQGLLQITEVGGGDVQSVLARNRAALPVLIVGGEHLEGAKQNRMATMSVLIAARSDVVIPVACVEQGRWSYGAKADFAPAPDFAFSRVRAASQASVAARARAGARPVADQGVVWAEVAKRHQEVAGGRSATGAMKDAFDHRRGTLQAIVAAFPAPVAGQTGVVACAGGVPVALDAFDRPETLSMLWARLVSGYALDALGRLVAQVDAREIQRFVRMVAETEVTTHQGVGLGVDVILTRASTVANALTWSGGVVHASAFNQDRQEGAALRPMERRIAGPRTRAGLRRHFHSPN
jgi:ARG/rhodanese/phosphatase superfamily protein